MTDASEMGDEQTPARDTFYDIIPERMWLNVTNIGVRAEGMVRVVLEVNGQEKELYHSYVIDGVISHGFNLTSWLHKAKAEGRRLQCEDDAKLIEDMTREDVKIADETGSLGVRAEDYYSWTCAKAIRSRRAADGEGVKGE